MQNIIKMSENLHSKLQQETDILMSDRLMTRDVLEARSEELASKRDDELRRVDQWATQQKALITEIFSALLGEIESDRQRNDQAIARIKGESDIPAKPTAKNVRHLKAAE
jgi:hypothetical protein